MYYRYDSEDEEFESEEIQALYEQIAEHNYHNKRNFRKRITRTFIVVSALIYLLAYTYDKIDSWLNALIWLAGAPMFSAFFLFFSWLALSYIDSGEYDNIEKLTELKCKFREIELKKEIRMLRRSCAAQSSINNALTEENRNLRDQLEDFERS